MFEGRLDKNDEGCEFSLRLRSGRNRIEEDISGIVWTVYEDENYFIAKIEGAPIGRKYRIIKYDAIREIELKD